MKLFLRQGSRGVVGSAAAASRRPVAVFLEQRHAREGLAAAWTRIALDAGVRLGVSSQVGPVGEGAVTVRTAERLLARVSAQVSLQQPRPRERLATQATAARQRVCPDVHLQRAGRRVELRRRSAERPGGDAVRTDELAPVARRHDAVELAVLRQTVERRVALAARLAFEARRYGRRTPPLRFLLRFRCAAVETGDGHQLRR